MRSKVRVENSTAISVQQIVNDKKTISGCCNFFPERAAGLYTQKQREKIVTVSIKNSSGKSVPSMAEKWYSTEKGNENNNRKKRNKGIANLHKKIKGQMARQQNNRPP